MAVGEHPKEYEAEVANRGIDEADELRKRQLESTDEGDDGQRQAQDGVGAAGLDGELVRYRPQHWCSGGVDAEENDDGEYVAQPGRDIDAKCDQRGVVVMDQRQCVASSAKAQVP